MKLDYPFITQHPIIYSHQSREAMPIWNPRQSSFKPIWITTRFLTNCLIYYNVFKDPGFVDELCGPLAIPAAPGLFRRVLAVEAAGFFWPILLYFSISTNNYKIWRLTEVNLPKALLLLMIKLVIIFSQPQRLKYYLHVFFLELAILVLTGAMDLVANPKMSEAWQIIVLDSLQRIAIFYEVTRTFCPNFAIYYFLFNLLLLSLSQIEAHFSYTFLQSQRMDPIYPGSLYVKQDIYRITIMTLVYYGLFSFLQAPTYGYGMAIAFGITGLPLVFGVRRVQAGRYGAGMLWLLTVFAGLWGLLWMRVDYPGLFKVFVPRPGLCGLFDKE